MLAGLRPVPLASTESVVAQVASGAVALGVLPWENSVAGVVGPTADLLSGVTRGVRRRVRLHRDVVLPVGFDLYVRRGTALTDLSIVASHPHALSQCREWLRRRLPEAAAHPVASTAAALDLVAEDGSGTAAALAAAGGSGRPGLVPLARGVGDNPHAETRFVVVGREPADRTGTDRTVVACFQTADRPGSLVAILAPFADRGIDLHRIGSRPTRAGMGRYYFLLECAGHPSDAPVRATLRDLAGLGVRARVLGALAGLEPARLADARVGA
jgi:prephenate dehydratase